MVQAPAGRNLDFTGLDAFRSHQSRLVKPRQASRGFNLYCAFAHSPKIEWWQTEAFSPATPDEA